MTKIFKILSQGGIGDALLLTPSLRAIKKRYPLSRTHIFCTTPAHLQIFKNNPFIDKLEFGSVWRHPIQTIRTMQGWATYDYRSDYGIWLPSLTSDKHAAKIIAEWLGVSLSTESVELFLNAQDEARGAKLLMPYKNCVVIHPKAAFSANKDWIWERWPELVERNPQYTFIQIGSSGEDYVKGCVDHRGISIRDTAAVIKAANALVAVDSLFAHVAAAVGTRAVVLFGATTPVIWGHPGNVNLYAGVRCSPCMDILRFEACPYGKECMVELSVATVETALNLVTLPSISTIKA